MATMLMKEVISGEARGIEMLVCSKKAQKHTDSSRDDGICLQKKFSTLSPARSSMLRQPPRSGPSVQQWLPPPWAQYRAHTAQGHNPRSPSALSSTRGHHVSHHLFRNVRVLNLLLPSQLEAVLACSLALFLQSHSSARRPRRAIRTRKSRPIRKRFWAM